MLLQMALFHSFYSQVTFHYIYHIFSHSSVKGHLSGFYVLDSVSSSTMNIGVHITFPIMVFSRYMSRSFFFFFFVFLFRAASEAYGSPQGRSQIGAAAVVLYHSHSNARTQLHLQPVLHLAAILDPCLNDAPFVHNAH